MRTSIREYVEAVRGRYSLASRKDKGRIWTSSPRLPSVIARWLSGYCVVEIRRGGIEGVDGPGCMELLWLKH